MAGLDLKGGLAAAAALAALAGCGTGGDPETLGGRLQGNWVCDRAYPEAGFLRRDEAKMDVHATSIHFNYNVSWSCDSIAPCPGEPPATRGGYFEGVFRDLGDSLALLDALDTLAFRDVTDSGFTLLVNGNLSLAMKKR